MRRYGFGVGFLWMLLIPAVAMLAAMLFPWFARLRGH